MAGPVTGPFVPAVHAWKPMVRSIASGAVIFADHEPRSKPTGNVPHSSSRALRPIFSNSPRVHSQAWVSLVELVRRGPILLARWSRYAMTWLCSRPSLTMASTTGSEAGIRRSRNRRALCIMWNPHRWDTADRYDWYVMETRALIRPATDEEMEVFSSL